MLCCMNYIHLISRKIGKFRVSRDNGYFPDQISSDEMKGTFLPVIPNPLAVEHSMSTTVKIYCQICTIPISNL